jgi:hypothetical protein
MNADDEDPAGALRQALEKDDREKILACYPDGGFAR